MADDILGVKMIYPTKSGGQQHYLQTHNQTDVFVRLGSGAVPTWSFTTGNTKAFSISHGHNTTVQVMFETSAGYDNLETPDHGIAKTRGYMEDTVDFRNVEISIYQFPTVVDADSRNNLIARTGLGNVGTDCRQCGYMNQLEWINGNTVFWKQINGQLYFQCGGDVLAGTGNCEDKWVGLKVMIYNIDSQGRPDPNGARVKMETWVDKLNNNVWTKVQEFTDTGDNVGTDETGAFPTCALNPRSTMTYGGPVAMYSLGGAQQNEPTFGDFSVREIDPGMPPDPSGPPPTGGGEVPPPPVAQVTISKQFTDMFHVAQNAGESCDVTGEITPLPYSELYDVSSTTPTAYFDLYTGQHSRAGIYVTTSSLLKNMLPKVVSIPMLKMGTPTGNIKLELWNITGAGILVRQIGTTVNIANLPSGTEGTVVFTQDDNTDRFGTNYGLLINYVGGDINNKLRLRIAAADPFDGANTRWAKYLGTTWSTDTAIDAPWRIEGYL
jgi:hypothetical protein